jgi:hypothetical protein
MANDRERWPDKGVASLLQKHAALNLWASYTWRPMVTNFDSALIKLSLLTAGDKKQIICTEAARETYTSTLHSQKLFNKPSSLSAAMQKPYQNVADPRELMPSAPSRSRSSTFTKVTIPTTPQNPGPKPGFLKPSDPPYSMSPQRSWILGFPNRYPMPRPLLYIPGPRPAR